MPLAVNTGWRLCEPLPFCFAIGYGVDLLRRSESLATLSQLEHTWLRPTSVSVFPGGYELGPILEFECNRSHHFGQVEWTDTASLPHFFIPYSRVIFLCWLLIWFVCVCVLLLVSFNLRMTEMVCVCTISSVIIFFLSNVCVRVAHSPKNVFSLYSLFICLSVCLFVCRPAGWLAGWFVCLFVWICGRGIHLLGWVGW